MVSVTIVEPNSESRRTHRHLKMWFALGRIFLKLSLVIECDIQIETDDVIYVEPWGTFNVQLKLKLECAFITLPAPESIPG